MIRGIDNRNAAIGKDIENLFMKSLPEQPDVIKKIQNHFGIKGDYRAILEQGRAQEKADVIIGFTCGSTINASIKTFTNSTGANQAARATIKRFANIFKLSEANEIILQNAIIRKARDTKLRLFTIEEQDAIGKFFLDNKSDILHWAFSYKASREILVFYNRDESIMYIYPMKEVLAKIEKEDLKFTKGGFSIGKYVSFQRKGGNGDHTKSLSKDSLLHPGNGVQFKVKIKPIIADMASLQIANYSPTIFK